MVSMALSYADSSNLTPLEHGNRFTHDSQSGEPGLDIQMFKTCEDVVVTLLEVHGNVKKGRSKPG